MKSCSHCTSPVTTFSCLVAYQVPGQHSIDLHIIYGKNCTSSLHTCQLLSPKAKISEIPTACCTSLKVCNYEVIFVGNVSQTPFYIFCVKIMNSSYIFNLLGGQFNLQVIKELVCFSTTQEPHLSHVMMSQQGLLASVPTLSQRQQWRTTLRPSIAPGITSLLGQGIADYLTHFCSSSWPS